MKRPRSLILLACAIPVAAMGFPAAVFGQNVGERTRVTTDDGQFIGKITSEDETGIVLKPFRGKPRVVVYSDIIRLERSVTIGNHWKRGAIIGLVPGAAAGALIGWWGANFTLFGDPPSSDEERDAVLGAALLGGLSCGLIGSGVGALFKRTKWETIPIPTRSGRVRVSPLIDVVSINGSRRTVLGARIRF